MADIHLRFHHDMLVLSTPIQEILARQGMDVERDNELALLIEPEILHEAYALEVAVGAKCIVADTANMTPARLAHSKVRASAEELARAALDVVNELTPEHVLVELAPCDLPIDPSSADSLNENRDQYIRVAHTFAPYENGFDAYFLNGFTDVTALKCALMGLRKATDKPIFANVDLALKGNPNSGAPAEKDLTLGGKGRASLQDAIAVMAEYGAQVVGFKTAAPVDIVEGLVQKAKKATVLPLMVQLDVCKVDPEQEKPTAENPYFEADTMVDAAERLESAGVQFLRAVGHATPSYTGALVAATMGHDVNLDVEGPASGPETEQDLEALAAKLKARVDAKLR